RPPAGATHRGRAGVRGGREPPAEPDPYRRRLGLARGAGVLRPGVPPAPACGLPPARRAPGVADRPRLGWGPAVELGRFRRGLLARRERLGRPTRARTMSEPPQPAAAGPVLSVVIPLLNEEDVLEQTYKSLKQHLDALGESYEIVFVDDGST